MAGETKIPKLQVLDLGTEGTGDRIALFDSDGKIVGHVLKADLEGFVPLGGTEVGKPITGDLELNGDNVYINIIDPINAAPDGYTVRIYDDGGVGVIETYNANHRYRQSGGGADYYDLSTGNFIGISGSGIVSNYYISKLSPNAFAQLGDIAEVNATVLPLSLATLNADYAIQGAGFRVCCPNLNLDYIKDTLTTWHSVATTTVV